jgi:hypothetical protein
LTGKHPAIRLGLSIVLLLYSVAAGLLGQAAVRSQWASWHAPNDAGSLDTTLREQLGLKLE